MGAPAAEEVHEVLVLIWLIEYGVLQDMCVIRIHDSRFELAQDNLPVFVVWEQRVRPRSILVLEYQVVQQLESALGPESIDKVLL